MTGAQSLSRKRVVTPHADPLPRKVFGLMAEFEEHEELLKAARKTYAEGYRSMDAYSPFPVEGLAEAIGVEHSNIPLVTLIGGMIGGSAATSCNGSDGASLPDERRRPPAQQRGQTLSQSRSS